MRAKLNLLSVAYNIKLTKNEMNIQRLLLYEKYLRKIIVKLFQNHN